MAIFIGAVIAYLMFIVFIGPENRGADLSIARDDEMSVYNLDDEEDKDEAASKFDDKEEVFFEKPCVEHKE